MLLELKQKVLDGSAHKARWDRERRQRTSLRGVTADVSRSEAGGVIYSCKGPDSDSGDR